MIKWYVSWITCCIGIILCGFIFGGCGVKFSVNFSKQDSNAYPIKTMSGNVSGRSSNPNEFKAVLTYLGFEIFDKEHKEATK